MREDKFDAHRRNLLIHSVWAGAERFSIKLDTLHADNLIKFVPDIAVNLAAV